MVSDRQLGVYLDGTLCGHLTQTESGNLTFTYEPDGRRASRATPLSLSTPLAAAEHKKRSILPFLQGLPGPIKKLLDPDEQLRFEVGAV